MAVVNPGRFVSFEGGEGCGKSTQARLLAEWLEQRQISVVLTREPGGTAGAEAIRDLLLDPPGGEWKPRAEALLFAAARSDHVERVIAPALARGCWVVCDRFVDSSFAYQGVAGAVGLDAVRDLHRIGSNGKMPDRTILLQLDDLTAAGRATRRDGGAADAIGGRGKDFHGKVAEAFTALAAAEPERFALIDAAGEIDAVQERVRHAILPLLERPGR